jgi:hypothetical protein
MRRAFVYNASSCSTPPTTAPTTETRLMKRFSVHLVALWIGALLACTSNRTAAEDDFQPMFNGTDLSGWVLTNTPSETWTFQDGLLICTGKPIGEIRTEKMYQNFIMELEWRHMVPRGNAGVFVWADDITARGVPFHRGIEVQVLENAYGNTDSYTTHGDIFPIHGATMTPINGRGGSRAFPTESRSNPSPEWNHYRIECRDGEISLAVNGKVVTRGKEASPRKGYICLESEGGVVHYRNIRIQTLPDTEIDPKHVAIADRGYESLYTGLNLQGWAEPSDSDRWKVNDWTLSHTSATDQTSRLVSQRSFDPIGFVVDVRLKDESSKATIAVGDQTTFDLAAPEIAKHLQKRGQWNRLELTAVNAQLVLLVNGQPADVSQTPLSGVLSLVASGNVDFCNVYARTIPKTKP